MSQRRGKKREHEAVPPLPTLLELETPEEDLDPSTPGDDEEADDQDDDDDLGAPRVVIGKVSDLLAFMPSSLARGWRDRPVWFLLEDDNELVGLFERIPEDPVSKGVSEAILGGLRRFATEKSELLQRVLGPTDSIAYGFHVDATYKQVVTSFEDDGFEQTGTLRDGDLIPDPEEEEEEEGEEGEGEEQS